MKNKEKRILEIGDIIYYVKNYIILGKENEKIICLPLNQSLKKSKGKINQTHLDSIDYAKPVVLDISEVEFHYLMTLEDEFKNQVIGNYKVYQKRQSHVTRGALVLTKGQLHYIYSEEGQNFIGFMVHNKAKENLEPIFINSKTYYINFDKVITISKKEEFDIKNLASDQEMAFIRNAKKIYFEAFNMGNSLKINNLKICKENLRPGTVFKLKHVEDSLIVMRVDGCLVTYINQTYLDIGMNFQSSTDFESIETILDASKETLENNKVKIKALLEHYK